MSVAPATHDVARSRVGGRMGCTIAGCEGIHKARGWCTNHYTCWRRTGNPLGRPIPPSSSIGGMQQADRRRRYPVGLARCVRCGRDWVRNRPQRGIAHCGECHQLRSRSSGALTITVVGPKRVSWQHTCLRCARPFVRRSGGYCSDGCRKAVSRVKSAAYYMPTPERSYQCSICGVAFLRIGRHGAPKACSPACARRTVAYREMRANANQRRRAAKRTGTVETVYRRKVYERDGWRCQLCQRPVKRDALAPDPLSPSLDHIIPLAAGGTHEYRNVQLAHFLCNSRKGVNGSAQLRLIA